MCTGLWSGGVVNGFVRRGGAGPDLGVDKILQRSLWGEMEARRWVRNERRWALGVFDEGASRGPL